MKKKPLVPLSAAAERLLPGPDQTLKCSVFAAEIDVEPAGTAISAHCVILVDTPLPWPKPVFEHPHLNGVDGKITWADGRNVKVLASTPGFAEPLHAYAFAQTPTGTAAAKLPLEDLSAVEAVERFCSVADPRDAPGAEEISTNAVLVCTQGSHDICCGSEGTRLADNIAADYHLAAFAVFRVSHTGGHRFAPTAMTFPDGRMWAFVNVDDLSIAVNRTEKPALVAAKCRGSWEASNPRFQAAEVAVLAEHGWPDGPADFLELNDDVVQVRRDGWSHDVRVTVAREVPTIRCRAAGGLPAKPSKEYRSEILGAPSTIGR